MSRKKGSLYFIELQQKIKKLILNEKIAEIVNFKIFKEFKYFYLLNFQKYQLLQKIYFFF